MLAKCIFCKIAKKEIPAEVITENNELIVFKDIKPDAPTHYLIIPKRHFESFSDVPDFILVDIKNMMLKLAEDENLKAFRMVSNWGDYQEVKHLHVHFTSGFKKRDY